MSKEELRKLLPMEFYAKEDMKIYTEISLITLNEIMKYISDKEQRIDKVNEILYDDNLCYVEKLQEIHKILGDKENETN